MASCPDSDNSWVLAGSESLPVETLGPESGNDPESERAPRAPQSPSRAAAEESAGTLDGGETVSQSESSQSGPILSEEAEAKGVLEGDDPGVESPGPGDTEAQGDLEETPEVVGLEPDSQDLEDQSPPRSLPSSPKTAWIREEAHHSSSEDDTDVDVEGLRRRRGREPGTPQPAATLGVEDQVQGEGAGGQLGISLNMCLLGSLVLLGLGVLLFGGLSESESGPLEEVDLQVLPDVESDTEMLEAVGDGQDGLQQLQTSELLDSVPSLQNMALLLDKLAKENQDIRLLQAQLQAQKEELQSLMRQPKGLEEENARLRGALQQGEASQRALESELQQLRAQLQGLEADCVQGADGLCLQWGRGPQAGQVTKEQGPTGQEPSPGFLARLPWAGPLTEELPLSPAYFGEDGIFRHDRLRFRDFVDALEDQLEEVAVRQTGDDDAVDDFEDFIFSHFFGDKALLLSPPPHSPRKPQALWAGTPHFAHSCLGCIPCLRCPPSVILLPIVGHCATLSHPTAALVFIRGQVETQPGSLLTRPIAWANFQSPVSTTACLRAFLL